MHDSPCRHRIVDGFHISTRAHSHNSLRFKIFRVTHSYSTACAQIPAILKKTRIFGGGGEGDPGDPRPVLPLTPSSSPFDANPIVLNGIASSFRPCTRYSETGMKETYRRWMHDWETRMTS